MQNWCAGKAGGAAAGFAKGGKAFKKGGFAKVGGAGKLFW